MMASAAKIRCHDDPLPRPPRLFPNHRKQVKQSSALLWLLWINAEIVHAPSLDFKSKFSCLAESTVVQIVAPLPAHIPNGDEQETVDDVEEVEAMCWMRVLAVMVEDQHTTSLLGQHVIVMRGCFGHGAGP